MQNAAQTERVLIGVCARLRALSTRHARKRAALAGIQSLRHDDERDEVEYDGSRRPCPDRGGTMGRGEGRHVPHRPKRPADRQLPNVVLLVVGLGRKVLRAGQRLHSVELRGDGTAVLKFQEVAACHNSGKEGDFLGFRLSKLSAQQSLKTLSLWMVDFSTAFMV